MSEARGGGRDKVGLEFGGIIEWYRPSYSKRESWSEYNVLVLKTTQCHRARKYTPGDARHSRKSVVLKIPAKRKSSIQQLFGPQSSRSIYPNFPQTVDKEFFPRYSRNSIQLPYIYTLRKFMDFRELKVKKNSKSLIFRFISINLVDNFF